MYVSKHNVLQAPYTPLGRRDYPPSLPALSVPAIAFVARDINLLSGTWPARVINGASPMTLVASGTPTVNSAAWAIGPMLDCATGCFFLDRAAPAADLGLSIAFAAGGNGTTFPIYHGPVLFSTTSTSALRLRRQSATLINARTGDGLAGRASVWTGTYALGDTLQFDRPAGVGTLLSAWLAYKEGVLETITTSGTSATATDGPRLIIGGMTDTSGVITPNADNKIFVVVLSQSGVVFSAPDRAAVTTWIAGLKSGLLR